METFMIVLQGLLILVGFVGVVYGGILMGIEQATEEDNEGFVILLLSGFCLFNGYITLNILLP